MTEQTDRDRIVAALHDSRRHGLGSMSEAQAVGHMADAVLAALAPAVPAGQAPATERAQCSHREPLLGVQCVKQAGHEVHSDRPGRIWYPVTDDDQAAHVDRAAVLREAADAVAEVRDTTDVNVAECPRYDFRQRVALGDAEGKLRRMAREAEQPAAEPPPKEA